VSKRSHQLFDYLIQIAQNLEEAAAVFYEGLQDLSNPQQLASRIKQSEQKGDDLTMGLISLLDATYITPLDREDYLSMAVHLDDIVDGLEACTVRFDLYNITEATPVMIEFAQNIKDCVAEILEAMSKLQARRLVELRTHTSRLNQLEKTGDQLLLRSLRMLFTEHTDAMHVIKLKEVYEILEEVTDRCEDVADVLDSVIVKNS
jgi:uncharacterized protein